VSDYFKETLRVAVGCLAVSLPLAFGLSSLGNGIGDANVRAINRNYQIFQIEAGRKAGLERASEANG
jgi:hypothetical protein